MGHKIGHSVLGALRRSPAERVSSHFICSFVNELRVNPYICNLSVLHGRICAVMVGNAFGLPGTAAIGQSFGGPWDFRT
jgi:hypothetical protein